MLKKTIKISVIGLLSILTLMMISYFIFIANAEKIVKEIVSYYTRGTMSIEMKKLKFNPGALRITIDHVEILTIDTTHQNSTYDIKIDTMVLELSSIRPILFHHKLCIDSITFKRPSISVIQWKETQKDKFSLPQQMGKVYTSLNNTLDKLSIKYCLLDSGAFSIEDKVHPERKKVTVTDFYFLIDNLHKTSGLNKDGRFFFSDKIKFYSSHQNIILASGNQQISYSRLRINSGRKIIELDSCFVFSNKNNSDFNSFSGYFDTLKFTNVDFNKLTQDNILDADSAYCIQPKIILKTTVKERKSEKLFSRAMSRDSFTVLMKYLLGNFTFNYIGVDNAVIEIQTKSDSKISSYQIKRTDFSMHDVSVVDHPDSSIKVGSFDLGLIGYKEFDPDSNYLVKFDSIHFINDKIFLSNFKISPSKKTQTSEFKDISMTSLAINNISWIDLLANRKIIASDIELINPELDLHLSSNKNNDSQKKKLSVVAAFKKITDYADVENLKIKNAHFQLNKSDEIITLKSLNCNIPVNRLLKSKTFNDFLSASLFVDFESAKLGFKKYQILLKKGKYEGSKNSLLINEALADDDKNIFHGYFQNLTINNPLEISPNHFDFSMLSWDRASLSMTSNAQANKNENLNSIPLFTIAKIQGKNTVFQTKSNALSMSGVLPKFDIFDFASGEKGSFSMKDLSLSGNKFSLVNKGLGLFVDQLDFKNKKTSSIVGLYLNADSGKKNIVLNIPEFGFSADINKLIKQQFIFDDIVIQKPIVSIFDNDRFQINPNKSKAVKFPEIKINNIVINNPEIHEPEFNKKFQPLLNKIQSIIRLDNIQVKDDNIQIKNVVTQISDMKFTTPKLSILQPAVESLKLSMKDFELTLSNNQNKLKWKFLIDTLSTKKIILNVQKDSSHLQEIKLNNASLNSIQIKNSAQFTPYEILAASPDFSIQLSSVFVVNNQSRFYIQDLNFNEKKGEFGVDNFSFLPVVAKEDFVKMNDYQKDYPIFKTGKINVKNFDVLKLVKDSVFSAISVNVSNPDLYIFKDKRKAFKKGVYKPLPSTLLKNVKFKFDVDSVRINGGHVVYEELNEKTNKSGKVKFSHLDATINNFKNHSHFEKDSLRLYVTGNFMDSAKLRFRLSESFVDSLHAFTYGLRFRPFDFKILNPILEPLVSARIISGSLDTLRVNAIGREHMSHGKMKMYYTDLKIQYLNKGNDSVKNFKSRLINFVANDLLLKRNNKKGFGIVYAERDKERGFANYWLKIGLSGVVSSSGVKKNKKVEKLYHKKLKKMKVPEIPDVDL